MPKIAKSGPTKRARPLPSVYADITEESYDAFLRNIELFALGMNSLDASLQRAEYAAAHADKASKLEKTVESTFNLMELGEDFFDVSAAFVFTMRSKGGEPFLRIAVNYEAHFHWKGSAPREIEVQRFAQTEARLIFWPYFRQAVSDVSARMYIRQITVPLTLRFGDRGGS